MNYVNVASFADDNTPYVTGDGVIQLPESLKKEHQTNYFAGLQIIR